LYVYCNIYIQCILKKTPGTQPQPHLPTFSRGNCWPSSSNCCPPPLARLPSLQTKRFYQRLFTPLITSGICSFSAQFRPQPGGRPDQRPRRAAPTPCAWPFPPASLPPPPPPIATPASACPKPSSRGPELARLANCRLESHHTWRGWVLALLDGSTVRLRPTEPWPRSSPQVAINTASAFYCVFDARGRLLLHLERRALDCAMARSI